MREIERIIEPEEEVYHLIKKGMRDSAFKMLSELPKPLSEENTFYLAYCQASMGHEFEALQNLNELRENTTDDIRGTFSAFMADILRNQGNINDALKEARFALEDCPDDEVIRKLFDEILDDWFDGDGGKLITLFTALAVLNKRAKKAYGG